MKILIISSYLPYPLHSGGHVRLYNLIKELGGKHQITLVCEKRPSQTDEDVRAIEKICKKVVTVPRRTQWSLQNIAQTGFSSQPFLVVGHVSGEMKKIISDLLNNEKFDLVHVETFYVMQNLPPTHLPIVLVEHNIEYLVYQRYIATTRWVLRGLLSIDVSKVKRKEQSSWQKATKLVFVSQKEKEIAGRKDAIVVPNGVDTEKFTVHSSQFTVGNKQREKRILFIGDFKWIQNRDSVEWILKEIWPKIVHSSRFTVHSSKLWIVGKHIPDSMKKLTDDPNVLFDEHASDKTEEIYQQASMLLAPIRVGGGTSYKILEAMASGVPVVTTPLGIEGLDVKVEEDVLVGDSAEALARHVETLLTDEKQYGRIAKNARKIIEEKYEWKQIAAKLEKVYASVAS